jgi:large subunit ribosomal protein L7/L12
VSPPLAVVVILFVIFLCAVAVKHLFANPAGDTDDVVGIHQGLRLTASVLVETAGSTVLRHPLLGLSARVETRYGRNDRVTVPRVLFLGVLALAARKKEYDGEVLLIIEGPETAIIRAASLRKNPRAMREAREFADLLNEQAGPGPRPAKAKNDRHPNGSTQLDVALVDAGRQQVEVVRAVRRVVRGLGILDAKELVTGTPSILLQQVPAEQAEAARRELESAGATVELW